MTTKLTISVPKWLDRLCAWPVLTFRRQKFGFTFRKIYLGEGKFTIVDPQDFYWLNNFHWCVNGRNEQFYAVRNDITANGKTKLVRMHREIMNPPRDLLLTIDSAIRWIIAGRICDWRRKHKICKTDEREKILLHNLSVFLLTRTIRNGLAKSSIRERKNGLADLTTNSPPLVPMTPLPKSITEILRD